MKKIIYATATKAVAVILFIACITTGLLAVTQGITRMEGEERRRPVSLSIRKFLL